jgi:hypothetical protein
LVLALAVSRTEKKFGYIFIRDIVAHYVLQAFVDEYLRVLVPCERWEVENTVGLGPLLRFTHRNDDTFHVMRNRVGMVEPFINVEAVFDGSMSMVVSSVAEVMV